MMMLARPFARQLVRGQRAFSVSARQDADFTHAVIGGGVVGLAVARRLQARDGVSTILIERHGTVGTETSSRNSEVIHAGLYYGKGTLKTELCVKGKKQLYDLCEKYGIPYSNCGKWVVAQDDFQMGEIEKVHAFSKEVGVPTHFISKEEAQRREPDVRAEAGALESPTTGIVDSHALMQYLQGDFEDKDGICAFHSPVQTIVPPAQSTSGDWEITTQPKDGSEAATITAETLINAAGLYAMTLSNSLLPPSRHRKPYYAKGSYFSYSLSHPKPKTLIYPAPTPGHGGLGTHLTIDMAGQIRFGPDVEWVDDPTDLRVNDSRLPQALDDIQSYLPGIDRDAVKLDYAGMRPKLSKSGSVTSGKGFNDFYIVDEEGWEGGFEGRGRFVNLLGIESPGLTSNMAIADHVFELLYR